MRRKNPEYMREILEYVNRYYLKFRRTPSCSELAAGTPLQRSAVHNYLVAMDKAGMLEYNGQTIMTNEIREMMAGVRPVSIAGTVSCVLPSDPAALQGDVMNLPLSLTGSSEVYLLTADGESMTGIGIYRGDLVLIQKTETARDGDIVAVWVEGEGTTLKRLRHDRNGSVILHPENNEMEDIRVKECRIQGIALACIKKLKKDREK